MSEPTFVWSSYYPEPETVFTEGVLCLSTTFKDFLKVGDNFLRCIIPIHQIRYVLLNRCQGYAATVTYLD